jgi:F-type H+-transporting ATPase subunit b
MFHDPRFWLAIAFITFIFLILKFARSSILKALEEKSKIISQEIEAAKDMKERAEALLAKATKYEEDSELYAAKLLQDAEDEAKKFAAESKKIIESEIAKKTAASMERIRMEEVSAIREIKARIINSAIGDLSQNISKDLDSKDHDKLITKALEDFEKAIS